MGNDIQKYVVDCVKCQGNKNENIMTLELIHPLNISNKKWEEISMDFIEGLPVSKGKDKIFVVVDRLTNYAHFTEIKKSNSAKHITEIFCKNIYKLHDFLKFIVSHRDAKFKGNF